MLSGVWEGKCDFLRKGQDFWGTGASTSTGRLRGAPAMLAKRSHFREMGKGCGGEREASENEEEGEQGRLLVLVSVPVLVLTEVRCSDIH